MFAVFNQGTTKFGIVAKPTLGGHDGEFVIVLLYTFVFIFVRVEIIMFTSLNERRILPLFKNIRDLWYTSIYRLRRMNPASCTFEISAITVRNDDIWLVRVCYCLMYHANPFHMGYVHRA